MYDIYMYCNNHLFADAVGFTYRDRYTFLLRRAVKSAISGILHVAVYRKTIVQRVFIRILAFFHFIISYTQKIRENEETRVVNGYVSTRAICILFLFFKYPSGDNATRFARKINELNFKIPLYKRIRRARLRERTATC